MDRAVLRLLMGPDGRKVLPLPPSRSSKPSVGEAMKFEGWQRLNAECAKVATSGPGDRLRTGYATQLKPAMELRSPDICTFTRNCRRLHKDLGCRHSVQYNISLWDMLVAVISALVFTVLIVMVLAGQRRKAAREKQMMRDYVRRTY
jgi:hypothetical protein